MKRMLAALVLLIILACALSCAHAQEIPEDILDWMTEHGYENESWHSLRFDLPDGSACAFLLNDWSLYGFLREDGAWRNFSSGSTMSGHMDLRFERHRQGQVRADGSTWPDDLGFDIVSGDGSRLSYHFDGQWFQVCGWYDPDRYPGEVIVQGTRLSYYEGGAQPVASVDAGDALRSWIGDFRWHPATPAEAQARERLLEPNVRDAFAGYTLQSYDPYNSGTRVNAAYLRISDGMLSIRRVTFTLEGETVANSIPVPLSETLLARLETEPVSDLIDASGGGDTFLADDALDTGRLPVAGTVLASDLQSGGLVLLVEDDEGNRLLQVIVLNADGTYRQSCLTAPLPPDTTLDLFHATDGEINFSWDEQHAQAGYALGTDGEWRLEWAWIPSDAGTLEYSSCRFWGVFAQLPPEKQRQRVCGRSCADGARRRGPRRPAGNRGGACRGHEPRRLGGGAQPRPRRPTAPARAAGPKRRIAGQVLQRHALARAGAGGRLDAGRSGPERAGGLDDDALSGLWQRDGRGRACFSELDVCFGAGRTPACLFRPARGSGKGAGRGASML